MSHEQVIDHAIDIIAACKDSLSPQHRERLSLLLDSPPAARGVPLSVRRFFAERLTAEPAAEVPFGRLWREWRLWAGTHAPEVRVSEPWLTRWLRSVHPHVTTKEVKSNGIRTKYIIGVRPISPP